MPLPVSEKITLGKNNEQFKNENIAMQKDNEDGPGFPLYVERRKSISYYVNEKSQCKTNHQPKYIKQDVHVCRLVICFLCNQ
jgi:hypothetical protein